MIHIVLSSPIRYGKRSAGAAAKAGIRIPLSPEAKTLRLY
jgi:hypothetical protein